MYPPLPTENNEYHEGHPLVGQRLQDAAATEQERKKTKKRKAEQQKLKESLEAQSAMREKFSRKTLSPDLVYTGSPNDENINNLPQASAATPRSPSIQRETTPKEDVPAPAENPETEKPLPKVVTSTGETINENSLPATDPLAAPAEDPSPTAPEEPLPPMTEEAPLEEAPLEEAPEEATVKEAPPEEAPPKEAPSKVAPKQMPKPPEATPPLRLLMQKPIHVARVVPPRVRQPVSPGLLPAGRLPPTPPPPANVVKPPFQRKQSTDESAAAADASAPLTLCMAQHGKIYICLLFLSLCI